MNLAVYYRDTLLPLPTVSKHMDAETVIKPGLTVEKVIEEFEGRDFEASNPEEKHFICDFCSKGVNYASNPRVGHYLADDVLNENHNYARQIKQNRPLVPLASYCEDCTTRNIMFPCEGTAEVRMLFDLDESRTMHNVEVTDVSPRDDGIPWDPREVSEKIMEVPFDAQAGMASLMSQAGDLWGPENMVTFFLASVDGVDIRELVQWNGSLDPKVLGQARRKFEDFQQEMRKGGHSRKTFRDNVRGSR